MGSISSPTSGLAYLTQAGGLLSNLPNGITAAELQSAPASDVVELSDAALAAQQVSGLFGTSEQSTSTLQLPVLSAGIAAQILPGISSADLTNATPQQQYAVNSEALQVQQTQELFG